MKKKAEGQGEAQAPQQSHTESAHHCFFKSRIDSCPSLLQPALHDEAKKEQLRAEVGNWAKSWTLRATRLQEELDSNLEQKESGTRMQLRWTQVPTRSTTSPAWPRRVKKRGIRGILPYRRAGSRCRKSNRHSIIAPLKINAPFAPGACID